MDNKVLSVGDYILITDNSSTDFTHIPADVWEHEVSAIIPYYGRISIEINKAAI